jgi:hypothetical protein
VKLFTCELGFKKTNGVLFKFLNQKLHSAKAFHIPSSVQVPHSFVRPQLRPGPGVPDQKVLPIKRAQAQAYNPVCVECLF